MKPWDIPDVEWTLGRWISLLQCFVIRLPKTIWRFSFSFYYELLFKVCVPFWKSLGFLKFHGSVTALIVHNFYPRYQWFICASQLHLYPSSERSGHASSLFWNWSIFHIHWNGSSSTYEIFYIVHLFTCHTYEFDGKISGPPQIRTWTVLC